MTGDLASTRTSLHALAEHVLCAARHQATGRIGLQVVPGGFATPVFDDDRQVAVVGTEVVARRGADARQEAITTLRAAADLAGVVPGAPADVFPPATSLEVDAPLDVDPTWAARLTGWHALGDEALRRLVAAIPDDDPSGITLWPEHFDVAIRAADVNYGASLGDERVPEPYLYVGPGEVPPADGYWNQPFGAAIGWADVGGVDDAVAFFTEGRQRARRP